MTTELEQLLNLEIANIEQNRDLWQSDYLPKLREFVNKVDQLPENDPNYPYKVRVVGTRGTIEKLPQEGIINRFLRKMQARVELLPPVDNQRRILKDTQTDWEEISDITYALNPLRVNYSDYCISCYSLNNNYFATSRLL